MVDSGLLSGDLHFGLKMYYERAQNDIRPINFVINITINATTRVLPVPTVPPNDSFDAQIQIWLGLSNDLKVKKYIQKPTVDSTFL